MINRTKMPRQLRNKGGITNVISRKKYGIGSDLKDFTRKIIPNELADVAVKAAPFVAPFYPGYAAIARGLGRFDQRGSISDALKQGAATYAFGKVAGKLGGAEGSEMGNVFGRQKYSMEGFRDRGLGRLFQGDPKPPGDPKTPIDGKKTEGFDIIRETSDKVFSKIPGGDKLPSMVKQQLLVGGITSGASALYSYFTGEFEPQEPGETMGEYMARRNKRVKQQMRGYMDSYYTPLRNPQYAAMSDEEKNNFIDSIVGQQNDAMMATGGRVGYQVGGISSANTLAENIRMNQAAQQQFSEFIAPAQQATRAAILAATPKSLTGPTTKLYSGTTSATPFGGSKFFATPDLATAKTYATSSPLRGSPLSGPVTGRILEAEVPTSQAQSLLKKGLTGTREVVLDPQAAKTLFETGQGALKGSASLGTKAALSATKALPVIGGGVTLADAASRLKQGDYVGAGLGAAGAVPGIGLPALGAQVVYDVAKNNPTIQKIGTSIGEGLYDLLNSSTAEAAETTPTQDDKIYINSEGTVTEKPRYIPGTPYNYRGDVLHLGDDPAANLSEALRKRYPKSLLKPTMADVAGPGTSSLKGPENLKNYPGATDRIEVWNPIDKTWTSIGMDSPENRANAASMRADIAAKLGGEQGKKYLEQYADEQNLALGGRVGLMGGAMPTGIMRSNQAGVMERDYRDKGGFVPVGIKEKADDVPAMLSKNEFVFTADAVRGAGNGSIEKGAQRMYDTMKNLERRVV
jgi:hypothetical protein